MIINCEVLMSCATLYKTGLIRMLLSIFDLSMECLPMINGKIKRVEQQTK